MRDETGVTFRYKGLPPRWPRAAARHDARAARIHPSLPAPCPATWLPPHPALRLAPQFRPQGQHSACPQTACRRTAAGTGRIAGTTRPAPALSLLRRPHDHHRGLRAMAASPRATSRDRTNREPKIGATGPDLTRGQFAMNGLPGQNLTQQAPPTPAPGQLRNDFNQAKLEIPIDHHRSPAGSCLGGFPTPDGIRKPSPNLPHRRMALRLQVGHPIAALPATVGRDQTRRRFQNNGKPGTLSMRSLRSAVFRK